MSWIIIWLTFLNKISIFLNTQNIEYSYKWHLTIFHTIASSPVSDITVKFDDILRADMISYSLSNYNQNSFTKGKT